MDGLKKKKKENIAAAAAAAAKLARLWLGDRFEQITAAAAAAWPTDSLQWGTAALWYANNSNLPEEKEKQNREKLRNEIETGLKTETCNFSHYVTHFHFGQPPISYLRSFNL